MVDGSVRRAGALDGCSDDSSSDFVRSRSCSRTGVERSRVAGEPRQSAVSDGAGQLQTIQVKTALRRICTVSAAEPSIKVPVLKAPTMTYDPHKAMPTDFFHDFLRITRKNGYHCVFPFGWKLADKNAYINDTLRPPLYDGWTFRVFFYAIDPIQSDTAVQVGWNSVNPSKYVIRAEARGGRPSVTGKTGAGNIHDQLVTNNIKQGEYFSLAIQIDGLPHIFRGVYNNLAGKNHDMDSISNVTKWHYKITPSLNIVTSIHVYDNKGNEFPDTGLGGEFLLGPVHLGVGSYGIFNLKYGSGSGEFARSNMYELYNDYRIIDVQEKYYIVRTTLYSAYYKSHHCI
ncbi:uncharacterized protein [Dermacentor albipictus]|uniref:uncharacterized protein isoform X2 n=1 Tax=Dermacentor albipictus TaxID=60249 RepID=UPI0031FD56A5